MFALAVPKKAAVWREDRGKIFPDCPDADVFAREKGGFLAEELRN